jgi:adenylate cyclase
VSPRRRFVAAGLGLCVAAAVLAWAGTRYVGVLRQGSAWLDDVRLAYFGAPRRSNERIVVLAIDEEALAELPFRSPISRRFIASLLDTLAERSVRAVGLDLIFDQPTIPQEDQAFLDSIARFPAPVVVAAGDERNGLTPRQLEFQRKYLAGRTLGAASVLVTDGVVRHLYPGRDTPDGRLGFAAAIAASVGVNPPTRPERIYFRTVGENGAPWVGRYQARHLDLYPAAWFEGAIVLIGADLPNQDRFATPLSVLGGEYRLLPGVEIHAQALAQLLTGEGVPEPSSPVVVAVLALAAALGIGLPFSGWRFAAKLGLGAGLLCAYWLVAFTSLRAGGGAPPLLSPALAFLFATSFASAYARYEDRAEKDFIRNAFQRYVAPAVIETMLADPRNLVLGGERREMSFVFSDLAGFTSLSEKIAPDELVALLQRYFDGLLRIALQHGGTIDRLVGDSVAVFFGAPAVQTDHAARAVRCALEWDACCETFRAEQRARGVEMGVTRIGVHAGTAVVGNVGSADRFHYTAHGDCVNTAARLESVNKHLGTRICISGAAARHSSGQRFRPVGKLLLKGKTEALECVTTCDALPPRLVEEYMLAYRLLERRDPAAVQRFAELLQQAPGDPLSAFHLMRLRRGEVGAIIALEEK